MIELVIERWSSLGGPGHFLWSAWQDGKRLEFSGPLKDQDEAEAEGRAWCETSLGQQPDRITRL